MKILVVGAGIAGPTLVHWLRRAGHEPTLLERSPEPRRGGYLVDFWGAGFDVAERMGITPELRRRGYVLDGADVVDREGHRFATIQTDLIVGADRYVSIARSELAEAILSSAPDGVETIWGEELVALTDATSHVEVALTNGHSRRFDLVIGADGLHSSVRRLAFGPHERFQHDLGIVVAAFESRGYRPRDELVAKMHAEVGFQALRVSLREDTTLFLLTVRHDGPVPIDDRAAQEALLRDRLAGAGWEVPAFLEELASASDLYLDSVAQIRMPSWHRGRVALVGDAASCPSLLAGQGSALAMVQAYTLAAELSRTEDHEEAFTRYEQRLTGLLRSKQGGAGSLAAAFAPANRRQLLMRNLVMRLMGSPLVVRAAMGRSFTDRVELPAFAPA